MTVGDCSNLPITGWSLPSSCCSGLYINRCLILKATFIRRVQFTSGKAGKHRLRFLGNGQFCGCLNLVYLCRDSKRREANVYYCPGTPGGVIVVYDLETFCGHPNERSAVAVSS